MATDQETSPTSQSGSWGWSPGRVIAIVLTVSLAGFWIWALSPLPSRGNPDRMNDRAFPAAAESICVDSKAMIDTLPPATSVGSLDERADLIDEGTVIVRGMLAGLQTLSVNNTEETVWVESWLTDYESYADDRDRFAAKLRAGDDSAPQFTVSGNENVQTLIFGFAKVNDMPSCVSPGDI